MDWNSLTPTMSKQNCFYFKLMALIYLFSAILIFFTMIFSKEKTKWNMLLSVVTPLLIYYVLLVFYSMCNASLS